MNNLTQKKVQLRQKIAELKQQYSEEELLKKSEEVFSVVELTGVFQEAKKIFIYYSMKDEVSTFSFIKKWNIEKEFYLPVVQGDNLKFRRYISDTDLKKSAFGVLEPTGEDCKDLSKIDLIIVPGIAFDVKKNRLGHGRGYYDKFLLNMKKPKMGVCFDFQLLDSVPVEGHDITMDYIISENDLIW